MIRISNCGLVVISQQPLDDLIGDAQPDHKPGQEVGHSDDEQRFTAGFQAVVEHLENILELQLLVHHAA